MEKIVIAVIVLVLLIILLFCIGKTYYASLKKQWRHDRQKKQYNKVITQINFLEKKFEKLSDEELKELTSNFRSELDNGTPLDDILVRAFAAVREAAKPSPCIRRR